MELRGQAPQEPCTRFGRIGGPIVIGAVSPIRAGRGDFAFIRVQSPPDAGMLALHGAGAGAPGTAAGIELVDHAVNGGIVAEVIFRYGDVYVTSCRADGVAGAVDDLDPHITAIPAVNGVVPPAKVTVIPISVPCRNPHADVAPDVAVVNVIGEKPWIPILKEVRAARGAGNNMNVRGLRGSGNQPDCSSARKARVRGGSFET